MRWGVGQPIRWILAIRSNCVLLLCSFGSFSIPYRDLSYRVRGRSAAHASGVRMKGSRVMVKRTELAPVADEAIGSKNRQLTEGKTQKSLSILKPTQLASLGKLHCVAGRVTHPGGRYSTHNTRSRRETTYCPFLGSTEPPIVNDFG